MSIEAGENGHVLPKAWQKWIIDDLKQTKTCQRDCLDTLLCQCRRLDLRGHRGRRRCSGCHLIERHHRREWSVGRRENVPRTTGTFHGLGQEICDRNSALGVVNRLVIQWNLRQMLQNLWLMLQVHQLGISSYELTTVTILVELRQWSCYFFENWRCQGGGDWK